MFILKETYKSQVDICLCESVCTKTMQMNPESCFPFLVDDQVFWGKIIIFLAEL